MCLHPISDSKVLKSELMDRDVHYTWHFEHERLPYRENVDKDLLESYLDDPVDLLDFVYADDEHEREKYELLFDKSSKYFLKIVLSM